MNPKSVYRPVSGIDLLVRGRDTPHGRQQLVDDALKRIEEIDPLVGAMTVVAPRDAALARASTAEGPLAGIPVAVKDIFDSADLTTSYGSSIYAGHEPRRDAAIVTQLRRNGAIVVGKTVTSEFAYMAPTSTRNPSDLQRTAGGSSSGSAAAVAAGMVPFAIGTQTGGSTIRPASFCGIAGYKPTLGMLPTVGMQCFSWSMDTVGLFAASIRDLAFFAKVLSGRELYIAHGPRAPVFAVPEGYPWTPPSANAMAVMEAAMGAISRHGGRTHVIRFESWMAELIEAHETIQAYEATRALGYEYDQHHSELSTELRSFLDRSASVNVAAYSEACGLLGRAKRSLAKMFEGVDALLTPSAPDEAPEGFASTGDPAFNRNWTMLGCPCINVPGLLGMRGAPLGVQVIHSPWGDQQCLAAAAFVERAIRGNLRGPH